MIGTAIAGALAVPLALAGPQAMAGHHPVEGCRSVQLQQNSGNGPDEWTKMCYGLKLPGAGHHWIAIVDGGPLITCPAFKGNPAPGTLPCHLVRHPVIMFFIVPNGS